MFKSNLDTCKNTYIDKPYTTLWDGFLNVHKILLDYYNRYRTYRNYFVDNVLLQ